VPPVRRSFGCGLDQPTEPTGRCAQAQLAVEGRGICPARSFRTQQRAEIERRRATAFLSPRERSCTSWCVTTFGQLVSVPPMSPASA
jgi:hypothetical protein